MPTIFHITTKTEWDAAKRKGFYDTLSLKEEGFIHCSEDRQVSGVLRRYFQDKRDLIKLVIETAKLESPFFFDWSVAVKDTFPHIYGPINIDAVNEAVALHQ
ncbi:MAG: DUF952 domain-containing protein [Bacteroidetes bacterium]|nr:DUF952 domain-containing protein [Bacteroidota bacterium]MBS1973321.1 DUF952 domain-containing protein [Bacteroidota bacterium]